MLRIRIKLLEDEFLTYPELQVEHVGPSSLQVLQLGIAEEHDTQEWLAKNNLQITS